MTHGTEAFEYSGKVETLIPIEQTTLLAPAGLDFFLVGLNERTRLPNDITENLVFREQAAERRSLSYHLRLFFDSFPDVHMSYREVIRAGKISEKSTANLLNDISDFLERDVNNGRILLYLPFELLPDTKHRSKEDALFNAERRFIRTYRSTWFGLLSESDMRANYVNGDILEEGLGEPTRLRKAAHLLPELLERGIVEIDEVLKLLDQNDDKELVESLTEGLIVAQDRIHFDAPVKYYQPPMYEKIMIDIPEAVGSIWVQHLFHDMMTQLTVIDALYRSSYGRSMSKRRVEWEKDVKRQKIIALYAAKVSERIVSGQVDIEHVVGAMKQEDHKQERCDLMVRGISEAVMVLTKTDSSRAEKLVQIVKPVLESLWEDKSIISRDSILTVLNHWARAGVISDDDYSRFGVKLPDLSSPFPVDLDTFADNDGKVLREITNKIAQNRELLQYLYPIALAMGSRIKGYANSQGDIDAAIIFKPTAPFEKREKILQLLKHDIPEIMQVDKIWEMWTENREGSLCFRYVPEDVDSIIDFAQAYMFLGGVWISSSEDLNKVYGDLCRQYLDLSDFEEESEDVRSLLLRQLELDIVQYRLMHKGYRRFYPSERIKGSEHSATIDWDSDFWDPGYRRVASLLFLSRVFLPPIRPLGLISRNTHS